MKKRSLIFAASLGASFVALHMAHAQEVSASPTANTYEELPELKASEILRPEFLQGTYFKIHEEVPTQSGANHFSIDSQFGVFEAEGNEMLVRRVNEINAIARLKDVSRTDEYKNALVKAAKAPIAAAKNIVTDPANAISNVPKGIMKFMGNIGETVKGVGEKQKGEDREGSQLQQVMGFSDAKRKMAVSLGVDPYSTNTVLQHELDGIAWASFAGGATFSLATLPVGGGAGAALTVTGASTSLEQLLKDKSPTDLKIMNRKELLAMGASASDAQTFLNNNAFSPTGQTAFVLSLASMKGVADRAAFVRIAGRWSSTEPDANFCILTAALMARLHNGEHPLSRIVAFGDFPICIAKDGTTILALQWDYAAWTAAAGRFTEKMQKFTATPPRNGKVLVAVSGMVSPLLRQELEARQYMVEDRLNPGPLQ